MKKGNLKSFMVGASLLVLFAAWTAALSFVDVRAVGPRESSVGFATLNELIHGITDVSMNLYIITDWLGLIPICFAIGFCILGLVQWIKRKSLLKVDCNLLALGAFYVVLGAIYIFFETFAVNYRPILIKGCLEASYPSSTTLLVLSVMPTSAMQLNKYVNNTVLKRALNVILALFMVFMVTGRVVSGVHWFSDVVGAVLLSGSLVMLYRSVII